MFVAVAGVIVVFLLLAVGLASVARLVSSRRGRLLQVTIDVECEPLPLGRGWRATTDSVPGMDFVGSTKTQAVGRAVAEAGKRLSVGVSA
jgi:hypothetical protein